MNNADIGNGAPDLGSRVTDSRLSHRAIRLDIAAIASALTFLCMTWLLDPTWRSEVVASFFDWVTYIVFFATPLLAFAGIRTAYAALNLEEGPLASWAFWIGLLLFVPSALTACFAAYIVIRGYGF